MNTPEPARLAGREAGSEGAARLKAAHEAPLIDLNALVGIVDDTHGQFPGSDKTGGTSPEHLQAYSKKAVAAEPLPVLRSELILEPVQFEKNGQPKWTLQDPIRGKYYRLGWLEFELLSRWDCNDVNQLVTRTNAETTLHVNRSHVDSLLTMLANNELLQCLSEQDLLKLQAKSQPGSPGVLKSAFSFTMFYRKPLLNPDALLTTLDKLIAPLYAYKRLVIFLWTAVALLSLNGISAHWYEFRNTFGLFMTFEGLALFGAVLVLTNILHEFGHGLVAKHYRCRVTEMGIALIFMLPVCYCDTSDTWRLADRHKRLLVSAGGLLMELAVATIACFLWLFLPDGILRTLAFFLAVTSLATTLFINLNPFMKFDGYYLLSDTLGVDNLQTRSFANFRWQLRRWFTGSTEQKPHRIPESSHSILNLYAASTWIYRLFLYFAICWMVYQFWFKALGLLLMTGVFITMIVTPVAKEAVAYGGVIKKDGLRFRSVVSGIILVLMLAMLVLPLPRKVAAPAVLGSANASKIFSTRPSRVSAVLVQQGDVISAGQEVITLSDPELEYEELKITRQLQTIVERKRAATKWLATDVTTQVSDYDIEVYQSSLQEVQEQIDALSLRASVDSTVTALPAWLKKGVWVNTNEVLAELASSHSLEVRAYVPAAQKELLEGRTARFYPNAGGAAIELSVVSISDTNIDVLDDQSLAVTNGGEIAAVQSSVGRLQPVQGWVMAVLSPVSASVEINSERTGYVMFPAQSKSLIASVFDRLYGAVLRESGF